MSRDRRECILDQIREAGRSLAASLSENNALHRVLDKSLQTYPQRMMYGDNNSAEFNGRMQSVDVGIGNSVADIARSFMFTQDNRIEDEYIVWKFLVCYQGRRIDHLQFTNYDGMGQSEGEERNGTAGRSSRSTTM